jgi:hypothetical protein
MDVRQVLPRDAIPSVDDPAFEATYPGPGDDEVVVVDPGGGATGGDGAADAGDDDEAADGDEHEHERDGDAAARAYPVRYLNYHEVVNDRVGGTPVAVTWCPLCGSAVVYDRRVDGRVLEFGVSGKLADDDLVVYDRETGSEWKQSLGTAIAGPLAGAELRVLPASVTTYDRFAAAHPDGVVLAAPGGESEAASDDDEPAPVDYDVEPYAAYVAADGFGLEVHRGTGPGRSWDRADLDPKAVVVGLERDGDAVGVPLPAVEAAGGSLRATVGGEDVVVLATDDGLHAFADPGFDLVVREGRVRGDGATFDPVSGRSDDGRRLERVPARRLFAFAWRDDHGPDAFHEPSAARAAEPESEPESKSEPESERTRDP